MMISIADPLMIKLMTVFLLKSMTCDKFLLLFFLHWRSLESTLYSNKLSSSVRSSLSNINTTVRVRVWLLYFPELSSLICLRVTQWEVKPFISTLCRLLHITGLIVCRLTEPSHPQKKKKKLSQLSDVTFHLSFFPQGTTAAGRVFGEWMGVALHISLIVSRHRWVS